MEATGSRGWELSLIDSAWHGSPYEGRRGLELARELGYEAIDLFVGFDPGRMTAGERTAYLRDVSESGLPPRRWGRRPMGRFCAPPASMAWWASSRRSG